MRRMNQKAINLWPRHARLLLSIGIWFLGLFLVCVTIAGLLLVLPDTMHVIAYVSPLIWFLFAFFMDYMVGYWSARKVDRQLEAYANLHGFHYYSIGDGIFTGWGTIKPTHPDVNPPRTHPKKMISFRRARFIVIEPAEFGRPLEKILLKFWVFEANFRVWV